MVFQSTEGYVILDPSGDTHCRVWSRGSWGWWGAREVVGVGVTLGATTTTGVLHRVLGVLHRVLGVLHRVLGRLHRVLGVLHTISGPIEKKGGFVCFQENPKKTGQFAYFLGQKHNGVIFG